MCVRNHHFLAVSLPLQWGCAIGLRMKLLLGVAKLSRLQAMIIFLGFLLTRLATKSKLKTEKKNSNKNSKHKS